MASKVWGVFGRGKNEPAQLTEEEVEAKVGEIKKSIQSEKKAIPELRRLALMYQNARDEQGKKMTEDKIKEIEKSIEDMKKRRSILRNQAPPRPLPQPEFVSVTAKNPPTVPKSLTFTRQNSEALRLQNPPPTLSVPDLSAPKVESPRKTEAQPEVMPIGKAKMLYDFAARQDDELSVKANDIVEVLQQYGYEENENEWWKVRLNGQIGFVPTTYVQMIVDDGAPREVLFKALACYNYDATKDDELSFAANDIIDILETEIPGWWLGVANGRQGLVPSNFLQKLSKTEKSSPKETEVRRSFPFYGEALYDYDGQFSDELSFRLGDVIKVTSIEMNGWYKGHLLKKSADGQSGLIAGNYLRVVDPSLYAEMERQEQDIAQYRAAANVIEEPAENIPSNSPVKTSNISPRPSPPTSARTSTSSRTSSSSVSSGSSYSQPPQENISQANTTKMEEGERPAQHSETEPLLGNNKSEEKKSSCCTII
eukprot:TRINITY_DN3385_c0_g1_i2.p1 TRINITY_DN3385_c0_g1~~TRINITY_DN3385_c0_g1_i2.p1  ORF type:complete len:482 (+),score=127.38 TRINITY_DN3385_c0_g1_i2:73-1518(+)